MTASSRSAEREDHSCSGGAVHRCIRPLGGAHCSGPSWKSARLRSHYRTDLSGPFGSPVLAGAGKTDPPSRLILSQTSAGSGDYINSGSSSSAERSLSGCRKDPPRLEVAPMGEDAPGDASQLVGERDRQHVVMQAPSGGLDPGFEPVTLPAARLDQNGPRRLDEQDAQVAVAALRYLAEDRAVPGGHLLG